ncbi:MAG: type II toxin-antitoxin system HicB family antitoxin [Treponema sp.]|jgi:predicted RNase H-like HicB family nuclease/DNA-binding XRE family transcriptional regulator|nr:type II toxin-antitoxin system HicB family antitoxin [Treponema sp.]
MKYHFKLHKEETGYWAECCELEGCMTEGDSLEKVIAACEEALSVYLYEPEEPGRVLPLPESAYDSQRDVIKIKVEPETAFAILLRNFRLESNMTQKQAAKRLGMRNIYSYQRLEKNSNPTLHIISKIHTVFPEVKLHYLFQ